MTKSRADQFAMSGSNFFHCYSRCVRQSFLCGVDEATGKDYEHRKGWIVSRIRELSQIFAIRLWSYAVMSNHYHIVIEICKEVTLEWSEEEVLQRWSRVYPRSAKQISELPSEARKIRIQELRNNLSNLSKYMSCVNQYISVKANSEENRKGTFWESRFKMKNLADEPSILAAMAYVDLSPIRAKLAKIPEASEHTSIQERSVLVKNMVGKHLRESYLKTPLQPISIESEVESFALGVSIGQYIELVDFTGRRLLDDKGSIEKIQLPVLERLKMSAESWTRAVKGFSKVSGYLVCHYESLGELLRVRPVKRFRAKSFAKVMRA